MRTYALNEARAEFSKVVDRALAGEPQRITRYGKQAVVLVSEADWFARPRSAATLGDLLAKFAETPDSLEGIALPSGLIEQTRPLGGDFLQDDDVPGDS